MKPFFLLSATALLLGGGAAAHFSLDQSVAAPAPARSSGPIILASHGDEHPMTTRASSTPAGLYSQSDDIGQAQPFILKHTDVTSQISGNVARVEVTQTFENPFEQPLEAVYVFPLPDTAAVDDMEIQIGDRTIRGDIKRRDEAQALYEQALQEGRTAGLLEQERDNIFTQSLANILPGEQIRVTIRYSESLSFEGGNYEFVFPMVVGPRYIPGQPTSHQGDTDQVPDASRITPPVLPPEVRSGHDINVTVEIDAGVPITDVRSPSHQIRQTRGGDVLGRRFQVQLDPADAIPNKDLILRYRVGGDHTQATVLTETDDQGGHFALYLIPALEYRSREIVPKDVVFLMDTSGSQSGDPLVKSQELMRRMINGLNPDDTFTIIDFANTATRLSAQPLANTPQNRARAIAYVNQLSANGGTELLNGIDAVMNFPAAPEGRLRSIVLLTDGYIGNETAVLDEVQRRLSPGNRLYSFGVGSSTNRFLLNRLAEIGRGIAQVIRQDEPTDQVAERFFRQINNPVLTNISVTWEGSGEPVEMYPAAAPDLFAEQPLVLFGRKTDGRSGRVRIAGTTAGGGRYEQVLTVNFDQQPGNPAIAQLWGRARIKDLMNQMVGGETTTGIEAVTNTALAYRLLSQYTAFIAISEEVRVDPDGTRRRVQVPVEMPDGVSYEGIFGAADNFSGGQLMGGSPISLSRVDRSRMPSMVAPPSVSPQSASPLLEDEASQQPAASGSQIELRQADGLDAAAIAQLEQYLQTLSLQAGYSGDVVLELRLRRGRVERVVLDDQASTLQDQAVINLLRQHLQGWSGGNTTGIVRLRLRINS